MHWGTFLGCHDRVADLFFHLDICQWHGICPSYVLYSGPEDLHLPHGAMVRRISPKEKSCQDAGWCLLEAVKWAKELGLTKARYTNCDDLLLSKEFVLDNFKRPEQLTAYNWFGKGGMGDFAINENYFDVKFFGGKIEQGERSLAENGLVENRFANWVKEVKPTLWRWAERERSDGIGNHHQPSRNMRFFNQDVGLLGHHDPNHKMEYYAKCRGEPYMKDVRALEGMPFLKKLWDTPPKGGKK